MARKPRKSQFDRLAQNIADRLTSEQYLVLLNIAHGPVPKEIAEMTDEELLKELQPRRTGNGL